MLMFTAKYTIPAIPPSLNRFAGRQNVHEYRKLKKNWGVLVGMCCKPRPPEPLNKANIAITYFFPTAVRHDPDNYAGKMLLDGLTGAGIIHDDSFDCISLTLNGAVDRTNPRVEIEIAEVHE